MVDSGWLEPEREFSIQRGTHGAGTCLFGGKAAVPWFGMVRANTVWVVFDKEAALGRPPGLPDAR